MKKVAIIGAGGLGKEVAFLLERIGTWNIIGFFDDSKCGEKVYGYDVLGPLSDLDHYSGEISIICAVANVVIRKNIIQKIRKKRNFSFPTLIDPSVIVGKDFTFGIGNIISAGNVLTTGVSLQDFNILSVNSNLGHDVSLASFNTLYPAVSLSGWVETGNYVEFGTGTRVIQNISIGENSIISAGSIVVRDVLANTLSVGTPAKVIKHRTVV